MTTIEIRWDDAVPGNAGWLVRTGTAEWQPPRGDLAEGASDAELAEMARREIRYHDGRRAPADLDALPVAIDRG